MSAAWEHDWSALTADLPAAVRDILAPGARVVVTGCAGFIGSHLTEALLALECDVVGVDRLTDYYDPALKRENLGTAQAHPRFTFLERDLNDLDAVDLLAGARACFHLAAQAGVRASWGREFTHYLDWNVLATQRLLEACRDPRVGGDLARLVYSSSSSVYGDQPQYPVTEDMLPMPRSPYGVSKLAAEHLCVLYAEGFQVPTASLRYFTVYGPRQRPDMAFRKFCEAALDGRPFRVYGDGRQTRDFTYVTDAVRANLLSVAAPAGGPVFNVGGGSRIVLADALELIAALLRKTAPHTQAQIAYTETAKGDVRHTYADRSHGEALIGYAPQVPFAEGIAREVMWTVARRRQGG